MPSLPATGVQTPKRPLHISVASLDTNASGIADSTISQASDWSVSQFPAPPTEIPTPTISNFGTPITPRFASTTFVERLPPSIPDYATPTRFAFGTPPPRSLADLGGHDSRSLRSGCLRITESAAPVPLDIYESTSTPQSSSSTRPLPPLAYNKDSFSNAWTSGRASQKRPESPHSLAGGSSLLDWSDAGSGMSVNPSEERLLSTSFITSLLSQSPEPFLFEKLANARGRLVQHLERDGAPQSSGDGASAATPSGLDSDSDVKSCPSHRSIPTFVAPFYPSDLCVADVSTSPHPQLLPESDRRSSTTESRHASADYSGTLHTDDGQLHSAVRSPRLSPVRGGAGAHPVGVMPTYRIPHGTQKQFFGVAGSLMTSRNSMITSTSIASKPPVHHADAPQNVRHMGGFDVEGVPRESEEEFVKMGGMVFDPDRSEVPSSPALPSAGTHNRFADISSGSRSGSNAGRSLRQSLQRNYSFKSVVTSVVSCISTGSSARKAKYIAWLRKRPLPPLPLMANPPPELPGGRDIQKLEEEIPLPILAKRAEDLQGMLSNGHFPAGSLRGNEFHYKEASDQEAVLHDNNRDAYVQIGGNAGVSGYRYSLFARFRGQKDPRWSAAQSPSKNSSLDRKKRNRRLWIIAVCVIVFVVLAIAIPVGITQREKGNKLPNCSGNMTGASCTLDATCVCTSSSGSCKPLAQSLSLLVSEVNSLFAAEFTASELSDAVVDVVGVSTNGLCAAQALLIDVEPGLDSASAPNRTMWAQAAILWNLGMSEDVNATTMLQKFVSKTASWDELPSADGPVTDNDQKFAFNASGFTFDFASQKVAPLSASFQDQGKPSDAQLAEVSEVAGKVLDRMYSYAIASSTQRQKSLKNYWTSVLQQQESDLTVFEEAVQSSSFFIPFDATSSLGGVDLTSLMSNTSSTPFPPPIACYPGLNSTQLSRINALETTVFQLDFATSPSSFSPSCFPDRPVYGVVDLLRLRLPFPDDRDGVALQAAALSRDATVRAVIYSGEVNSALPGATALPDIVASTTDPREFGTASSLNHVLLNYLSSISNVSLAMDLVSHVLSSSGAPANNSDLSNSLSSLPVLEFAVFGSITPQDIAASVSSFSTPSGALFFGSNAGETFREWAFVNASASIAWTESAVSSEIVRESATVDGDFEDVWTPASKLVAAGPTNANDVQTVTTSLDSQGLFSST